MKYTEAYIRGLVKKAEDLVDDPIKLVRMRTRIDSRTLDRFAAEDAALRHKKGKNILKHSITGGISGTALGALICLLNTRRNESKTRNALVGSALGGVTGAGAGVATGAVADILDRIKSKRERREHVDQFLDSMYMPV